MICFLCNKTFQITSCYIAHLKSHHFLKQSDTKVCTFGNCKQLFSSFGNFKNHLLKHMNEQTDICKTIAQTSVIEVPKQKLASGPCFIENFSVNCLEENIVSDQHHNTILSKLSDNLLQFSVKLYSKSSMSRKDVLFIQNECAKSFQVVSEYLNESLKRESFTNRNSFS